jgi:hypothetical protein
VAGRAGIRITFVKFPRAGGDSRRTLRERLDSYLRLGTEFQQGTEGNMSTSVGQAAAPSAARDDARPPGERPETGCQRWAVKYEIALSPREEPSGRDVSSPPVRSRCRA